MISSRGIWATDLSQLDSPFQLQEHLKSLYSHLTHTEESTHTIPIMKDTALQLATPPQINDTESVDRNLWLYELCRFLTQKANIVSIFLMNDNPPCSSQTCPEMRASEWQYLCAVHEPPKSCCAIDYCNHTLDWAANVLTSPKHFPSRLALGSEAGNAMQSMRQLTNIFRRVYRIFAHAWFQHRDVFWSVEATYGLYMLFKVVCDEYHLIPEDSYTIPPEAEGGPDAASDQSEPGPEIASRVQILRKDDASSVPSDGSENTGASETPGSAASTTVNTGATTRRHKHTPSTGSHVGTIAEGQEEEDETTSILVAPKDPISAIELTPEAADPLSDLKGTSSDRPKPKLDISSTVPKYEPRAPEDPTPTGTSEDIDPLSVNTQEAAKIQKEEPVQVSTPITQTRPQAEEEEEEVTSPSGGSIRTGGSDLLKAILGHIDDLDDDKMEGSFSPGPSRRDVNEQMSPIRREAADDQMEVKISVEEAIDDDDDDVDDKEGEPLDGPGGVVEEAQGGPGDEDESSTVTVSAAQ